mmetsp:Transcript_7315/g.18806  ORF Transcript_7315/g.18806 Transcript_7315/m.18806 type:complete len:275 (-) Transcript_7315:1134-1958(-)
MVICAATRGVGSGGRAAVAPLRRPFAASGRGRQGHLAPALPERVGGRRPHPNPSNNNNATLAGRPQRLCQAGASTSGGSNGSNGNSAKEISAKTNLGKMGNLLQKCGWFGFWGQFALITVSSVMTVFSVIFTKPQSLAAKFSLYLVLVGVAAGYFSTYWTFGYLQLAKKIKRSIKQPSQAPKRAGVDRNLSVGISGNVIGMGTTLLGMQAVVGFLVAKTLANATANPFLSGGAGSWNPVLALDVFLVQAATNCLLSHFMSLCMNMWLQNRLRAT